MRIEFISISDHSIRTWIAVQRKGNFRFHPQVDSGGNACEIRSQQSVNLLLGEFCDGVANHLSPLTSSRVQDLLQISIHELGPDSGLQHSEYSLDRVILARGNTGKLELDVKLDAASVESHTVMHSTIVSQYDKLFIRVSPPGMQLVEESHQLFRVQSVTEVTGLAIYQCTTDGKIELIRVNLIIGSDRLRLQAVDWELTRCPHLSAFCAPVVDESRLVDVGDVDPRHDKASYTPSADNLTDFVLSDVGKLCFYKVEDRLVTDVLSLVDASEIVATQVDAEVSPDQLKPRSDRQEHDLLE